MIVRSPSPPPRSSLSDRPLILAAANAVFPITRVDSAGIWILQHRHEGAPPRPSRAHHAPPTDEPYDLPDSYWHRPPRVDSPYGAFRNEDPARNAEHFDIRSESSSPERSANAFVSGRAGFNPNRVYEAEEFVPKRPAPTERESSAPVAKARRIVFGNREPAKAPPHVIVSQAAADRAAAKAIPPPPLRQPPAPPAPVPRAAAPRAASVPGGGTRPQSTPPKFKQPPPPAHPQQPQTKLPPPQPPQVVPAPRAFPSDQQRGQWGQAQAEERNPLVIAVDWHNTLDIAADANGAPSDWLLYKLSKIYRNHYPIEFRIISFCTSRDTRERTLRTAGHFVHACNSNIPTLGTDPFGEVILTYQRVGPPGKAAALARIGACVIIDDNNAVLRECRIADVFAIGVGRRDQNRALYDAFEELDQYLQDHRDLLRPARVLRQEEYLEEAGRRPHSARGGRGLFR